MTSPRTLTLTVLAALAAFALPASALAAGPALATPGSVRQVSGPEGCYTLDGSSLAGGTGSCVNIRGGDGSTTVTISPDGRSAYLVGYGNNSTLPPVLSVFSRNQKTGVLTQLHGKAGCLSRDGSSEDGPGTCTKARDVDTGDATSIAISADGRFVYVASQYEAGPSIGGIAIFSRNLSTGALRQLPGTLGCISSNGSSLEGPHTCARGREVDDISNVHITPDQKFLYASNYDSQPHSGIAIFARNAKTGALRQLGGVEGCLTTNGTTRQSGTTKVCRAMPNIGSPWDVATPGNLFAYIPDRDDNLVQAFKRDAKGGLVPLKGKGACVSDTGDSPLGTGSCVAGHGLFDVERAVLSKNERFIYTNGFSSPSPIAVLNRNLTTGLLSERSGKSACFSATGMTGDSPTARCRVGRLLGGGYAGKLSPDGKTLYYAEDGDGGDSGLVIFRVNLTSGSFTQLSGKAGCVSADGASQEGIGTCQVGRAVRGAYQVGLYSPGKHQALDVYLASNTEGGIALFRAAP